MSRLRTIAKAATTLCVAVALPLELYAEQPDRAVRVGFLAGYQCSGAPIRNFMAALNDLGWIEGKNLAIQCETPGGQFERFPAAVAQLLAWQPHVILAFTNASAIDAKRATDRVPIVVFGAHAAVEIGLVSSMARPGGNVTGTESLAPEVDAKRLEFLKQVVPDAKRVGGLYNPLDEGAPIHLKSVSSAAQVAGLRMERLEVKGATDIDVALDEAARTRPDGLLAFSDVVVFNNWKRIDDFARERRLPTVCEFREMARAGCLLSYGPDLSEFGRITARQVDRILKGSKPDELPMEQLTRFSLVINLVTAREIGVSIPKSVLVRADEVIE